MSRHVFLMVVGSFLMALAMVWSREDERSWTYVVLTEDQLDEPLDPVVEAPTFLQEKIKVCLRMNSPNPRRASIFARNYLQLFGGRLDFHLEPKVARTLRSFYKSQVLTRGSLDLGEEPCDPDWPVLELYKGGLPKRGKNFRAPGALLISGDEWCSCSLSCKEKNTTGQTVAQLRNYYSTEYTSSYVPLGPQFWFEPFNSSQILKPSARHFPFNFAGSITSNSRVIMVKTLNKALTQKEYPNVAKGMFQFKRKWSADLTSKAYVHPKEYREMLLNSTFTLCPSGKNVESYRIHEAVEAGSIPVLALDSYYYKDHRCKDGFRPYIDSKAPFIFVKDWADWPKLMEELLGDLDALEQRQKDIAAWKVKYWSNISLKVECTVLEAHNRKPGVKVRYPIHDACKGLIQ